MVAIEHRQKSAIVATDDNGTTAAAATTATITNSNLTLNTSLPRRASDIVNSNDIEVFSSSNASTSSTATTINTTASNIVVVIPRQDSKDNERNIRTDTSPNHKNLLTKMSQTSSEASTVTAESSTAAAAAAAIAKQQLYEDIKKCNSEPATVSKSAVSQRNIDIQVSKKSNKDNATKELTKKVLKLDLTGKELDEYSVKSPKSPIATRLPHQASLTTVDVEDRKTLREALYHGIFHRHRRTIFAVGSFLRMLRSRNSSYNTIRSSSEGEDVDEAR